MAMRQLGEIISLLFGATSHRTYGGPGKKESITWGISGTAASVQ